VTNIFYTLTGIWWPLVVTGTWVLSLTSDGRLMDWFIGSPPRYIEGQTGIKQIAESAWLKKDGTVWTIGGKIKSLSNITLIGSGGTSIGALSSNGELFLNDPYQYNFKKLIVISNPTSVKEMAVYDDRLALLYPVNIGSIKNTLCLSINQLHFTIIMQFIGSICLAFAIVIIQEYST
jgi:hypothetical protein